MARGKRFACIWRWQWQRVEPLDDVLSAVVEQDADPLPLDDHRKRDMIVSCAAQKLIVDQRRITLDQLWGPHLCRVQATSTLTTLDECRRQFHRLIIVDVL